MSRDYVTLAHEKHALVHFPSHATMESPGRKQRQIWYLHTGCGKKVRRGEFKTLGDRSRRRFYTCVKCARHELPVVRG